MRLQTILTSGAALAVIFAAPAYAQNNYISASAGVSLLQDSDNEGRFAGDFTTGAGTTVPAGAVLPDGTAVGWTTEFETGMALSAALGRDFGFFRGEIEVAWQENDVDTHRGVEAGGIALDSEDAGVLITGADNIGVSVGDLVADGRGELQTVYVFANILYDLDLNGPITPYIGGGVGVGFVDVEYVPSDVGIIDDSATQFAYQGIIGAAYEATPRVTLFTSARYRGTLDAEVEASLFSADFDVENRAFVFDAGLRFAF